MVDLVESSKSAARVLQGGLDAMAFTFLAVSVSNSLGLSIPDGIFLVKFFTVMAGLYTIKRLVEVYPPTVEFLRTSHQPIKTVMEFVVVYIPFKIAYARSSVGGCDSCGFEASDREAG